MWSNHKSTWLSLSVTYLFMALLLGALFFGPRIVGWYLWTTGKTGYLEWILLAELYACSVPAAIALFSLRKLLLNILHNDVFILQNVFMLRVLSWCCFFVAAVTFAGGYTYLPFYLISAAASFIALIVRIVKNVISTAVELKQENDMTI